MFTSRHLRRPLYWVRQVPSTGNVLVTLGGGDHTLMQWLGCFTALIEKKKEIGDLFCQLPTSLDAVTAAKVEASGGSSALAAWGWHTAPCKRAVGSTQCHSGSNVSNGERTCLTWESTSYFWKLWLQHEWTHFLCSTLTTWPKTKHRGLGRRFQPSPRPPTSRGQLRCRPAPAAAGAVRLRLRKGVVFENKMMTKPRFL